MKKIITVLIILFIINVGCKKENVGGGGLCACSPVRSPELNLVIKNASGNDLLNDKTAGAYLKNNIQLYIKDANSNTMLVNFNIKPPFSYGNEKFAYNLLSAPVSDLGLSVDSTIYLKLGNDKLYRLSFMLNKGKYDLEKLLIDGAEAEKDKGNVAGYLTIFYLKE